MELFDTADILDLEIVKVQILDQYFKNGAVRLGSYFYQSDYIENDLKLSKLVTSNIKNIITPVNVAKEDEGLTIDDILEDLVASLDIYSYVYDLGKIEISNLEWELFFNTLAKYYHKKELDDFFIDDMDILNKMALASSLVYEEQEINLKTYIRSLRYMESNILSIDYILEIVEEIEKVFGIDATSIIANQEGEIRCIGADVPVFYEEFDEDEIITTEVLKNRLEAYNYKVIDKKEEENKLKESISVKNKKVIDFYTLTSKKAK